MKKSVSTLINETIKEAQIDLNSPFKLERKLLNDLVLEKINFVGMTASQAERKVRVVGKMVNMMFNEVKLGYPKTPKPRKNE